MQRGSLKTQAPLICPEDKLVQYPRFRLHSTAVKYQISILIYMSPSSQITLTHFLMPYVLCLARFASDFGNISSTCRAHHVPSHSLCSMSPEGQFSTRLKSVLLLGDPVVCSSLFTSQQPSWFTSQQPWLLTTQIGVLPYCGGEVCQGESSVASLCKYQSFVTGYLAYSLHFMVNQKQTGQPCQVLVHS